MEARLLVGSTRPRSMRRIDVYHLRIIGTKDIGPAVSVTRRAAWGVCVAISMGRLWNLFLVRAIICAVCIGPESMRSHAIEWSYGFWNGSNRLGRGEEATVAQHVAGLLYLQYGRWTAVLDGSQASGGLH